MQWVEVVMIVMMVITTVIIGVPSFQLDNVSKTNTPPNIHININNQRTMVVMVERMVAMGVALLPPRGYSESGPPLGRSSKEDYPNLLDPNNHLPILPHLRPLGTSWWTIPLDWVNQMLR